MTHTDDSYAYMLLTLRLKKYTEEYEMPLSCAEADRLLGRLHAEMGMAPDGLRQMSFYEMQHAFEMTIDEAYRIKSLLDRENLLMFELDRCMENGIEVVTPYNEEYPERLKRSYGRYGAPALFVCGSLFLLNAINVGILGIPGIKTPEAVKQGLEQLIPPLAGHSAAVITGGELGANRLARQIALNSGALLTTVHTGGMAKYAREHYKNAEDCRELVLSQLNPFFEENNSLISERNRLIYVLSDAAFLATALGKPNELPTKYRPYLYAFNTPENRVFAEKGYTLVSDNINTAWIESKLALWKQSDSAQLSIFD